MSLEQLESAIVALSLEERRKFSVWFEQHRNELLGDLNDRDDLTDEQRAGILRRRELALAHPELLEPWEGTVEKARQRLHELRSQKAPIR